MTYDVHGLLSLFLFIGVNTMSDTEKKTQEEQAAAKAAKEAEEQAKKQELSDDDLDNVAGGKGGKTKW